MGTWSSRVTRRIALSLWLICLSGAELGSAAQTESPALRICATVLELADLARAVGGERVSVVVFAKGTEDPGLIEPKPSFVKALREADLYVQLGDVEKGWAPQLLRSAGNNRILPGAPGYLDVSAAAIAAEPGTSAADQMLPSGPYYLLDPLNGLRAAALIRDKLIQLRPEQKAYFTDRYIAFARRLASALLGEELARRYGIGRIAELADLFEHDNLAAFLHARGELQLLGGWFGKMYPHYGQVVVADTRIWPYFARRFGLKILGEIEPRPGVAPTTRHVKELVRMMREVTNKVLIVTVYYDPRQAQFIADQTGAQVIRLAHRVGAVQEANDYINLLDYDVQKLAAHGTHPPRPGRFEIHQGR